MTDFINFVKDFPERSLDILENFWKQAEENDREVTLMLSVAATGLIVPFERLRKPPDGIKHPSGNREKYERAVSKFSNLCPKLFLGSDLWQNEESKSWRFLEKLPEKDVQDKEVSWAQNLQPLKNYNCTVKDVLAHLRNALAHGNIFVYPHRTQNDK